MPVRGIRTGSRLVTNGPGVEWTVGAPLDARGDAMSDMRVETRPHRLGPELGDGSRSRPTEREHRTAATTAGVHALLAGILLTTSATARTTHSSTIDDRDVHLTETAR